MATAFGGADYGPNQLTKHVPIDIDGIYVTPDGKVYTNTGWDEGGRALTTFKNGNIINPLNSVNNNNGGGDNAGGIAVAADNTYVYQGQYGSGVQIKNVADHSKASVSLTGSSTLAKSTGIYGISLNNKKLYVTENDVNKVEVFDTTSLSRVSSFAVPNPARIAVDSRGGFWVSHLDLTVLPPGDTWGNSGYRPSTITAAREFYKTRLRSLTMRRSLRSGSTIMEEMIRIVCL